MSYSPINFLNKSCIIDRFSMNIFICLKVILSFSNKHRFMEMNDSFSYKKYSKQKNNYIFYIVSLVYYTRLYIFWIRIMEAVLYDSINFIFEEKLLSYVIFSKQIMKDIRLQSKVNLHKS